MGDTLCKKCGQRNDEGAVRCSNCDEPLGVQADSTITSSGTSVVSVEVVDIDMPFISMVYFMVKLAIAAIPAVAIIAFVYLVFGALFAAMLGS